MAHRCKISGVGRQTGHRISHAKNKSKHVFRANLQEKRVWAPELKKYIRVRVTTRILRTIDRLGLTDTLKRYQLSLSDITA